MTREELRDYVEILRSQNEISYDVYSGLIDEIDTLEQEPKAGYWIEYDHGLGTKYYRCPICKGFEDGEKGKYCKWCGAKMVDKEINNG